MWPKHSSVRFIYLFLSFGAVPADLYHREGLMDRKSTARRRASALVALGASGRLCVSEVLPSRWHIMCDRSQVLRANRVEGLTAPCLVLLVDSVPFPVT